MAVLAVISAAASQCGQVYVCRLLSPLWCQRPWPGSLIFRYTVSNACHLIPCTLCGYVCTVSSVSVSLEVKVTTSANTRELHICSRHRQGRYLSVERLELCPSGELSPVCLYSFLLCVVMRLWNPLPKIPGNPRASWDITKLALFLCLCLFHWRLHYVSLSDFLQAWKLCNSFSLEVKSNFI